MWILLMMTATIFCAEFVLFLQSCAMSQPCFCVARSAQSTLVARVPVTSSRPWRHRWRSASQQMQCLPNLHSACPRPFSLHWFGLRLALIFLNTSMIWAMLGQGRNVRTKWILAKWCGGVGWGGREDAILFLVLWLWADPGGTAIPGQPVARAEQAPDISPRSKNQFNIEAPQWGAYQILSW